MLTGNVLQYCLYLCRAFADIVIQCLPYWYLEQFLSIEFGFQLWFLQCRTSFSPRFSSSFSVAWDAVVNWTPPLLCHVLCELVPVPSLDKGGGWGLAYTSKLAMKPYENSKQELPTSYVPSANWNSWPHRIRMSNEVGEKQGQSASILLLDSAEVTSNYWLASWTVISSATLLSEVLSYVYTIASCIYPTVVKEYISVLHAPKNSCLLSSCWSSV